MMEPILCLGNDPPPPGEAIKVERERPPDLKRRRSQPPLSPERLEEHLDSMRARGVHLSYDGEVFTLRWPPRAERPHRDAQAFRDIERVRVNFKALLERFGLKPPKGGWSLDLPLLGLPIAFCDLETTGLKAEEERICELSICLVEPGIEPEWFTTLINPERPITNSWIHGIYDKDVKGKPFFSDVAEKALEFLDNAVFISHTTNSFDQRFLSAEFDRAGLSWEPPAKLSNCTLAKRLLREHPSHKLQELVKALGIRVSRQHRAEDDVRAMMELFYKHLLPRAEERPKPPKTLAEFQRL